MLWGENKQHGKHHCPTYTDLINIFSPSFQLVLLACFIDFIVELSQPKLAEDIGHQITHCHVKMLNGTVCFLICRPCQLAQPSYVFLHLLSSENIFCVVYRHFTFPLPNISLLIEHFLWFLLKYLHNFTFLPTQCPLISIKQCCIVFTCSMS